MAHKTRPVSASADGACSPAWHAASLYFPHAARQQPVSIVVTVLNEAEDIARGVASLLAQEPSATEVIVVDGGSSDGTWEWLQEMQAKDPRLVAIRDETCSLKFSPGPVSRGRNVAIAAARTATIATADAGCTYAPDWLANLTAPLVAGTAEYALGGSCLDPGTIRCGMWLRRRFSASSWGRRSRRNPARRGRWRSRRRCGSGSGDFPKRCWWARIRSSTSTRGG